MFDFDSYKKSYDDFKGCAMIFRENKQMLFYKQHFYRQLLSEVE